MKRNLLLYRVADQAGDWFYYFAIVLIVYGLNKSPWVLGVLSASYTLPGVLFSSILLKALKNRNPQNALIIQLIVRMLCLIFMILTRNIFFLLFLIFLEQIMAVGCNMSFQSLIVSAIHGNDNLKKFNKEVTTYTNIFRLLVIPIYFLIENHLPIYLFMSIDIGMKLLAIIFVKKANIVINDISNEAITKERKPNFSVIKSPLFKFVVMLVAISYVVAFNNAYSISYINKLSPNPNSIYACLTFLLALSDVIGSFISKRLIDFYEKNNTVRLNQLLLLIVFLSGGLFATLSIFNNIVYFIIILTFIELVYIYLQLFCLYLYQKSKRVMELIAFQNVAVDGIAFFNSNVGALIISSVGMNIYVSLVGFFIMLAVVVIFVKREKIS